MTAVTFHLHIHGQVQGVGFRPFVYRLAQQWGIPGWVNNAADGVHVEFNAEPSRAQAFVQALLADVPPRARVTQAQLLELPLQMYSGFDIRYSAAEATPNLTLSPDFALCAECRQELHDPRNRRYRYPFTTCTQCGPRFSITRALPYDRENTAFHEFGQCPTCQAEYQNVSDRRYYSQTNSCPTCGITLTLRDAAGNVLENPLELAVHWLNQGKILAVKGLGGYLLLTDATNAEAVARLRQRKHRPSKPLAVLYPSLDMLQQDVQVPPQAAAILNSAIAPIVLLDLLLKPASGIAAAQIAPGLQQIGAFLPYQALLEILAKDFAKPLVATSGNIAGSPILFKDNQAHEELLAVADGILSHNLELALPQDDSVVRFSQLRESPMVLRRSRGMAPAFFSNTTKNAAPENILAVGALLKSAFAWLCRGTYYISPYLGDLENYVTQQHFEHTLQHFQYLLLAKPDLILVDRHPEYFSTELGRRLAAEWAIPVQTVQHHQAHFAAVLGENDLLNSPDSILGVIWDGTGYGDDGQSWGGEFFVFADQKMSREAHLAYFPQLLGDKMAREPRLSALSLLANHPAQKQLESFFTSTEWALYQKIVHHFTGSYTSSMGRLFDGVAALLGLATKVSYEGEAALLLEAAARRFFQMAGLDFAEGYEVNWGDGKEVSYTSLLDQLLSDRLAGVAIEKIAAKFHLALVNLVQKIAERTGCRKLAFSGGVFQNALLVDLLTRHLVPHLELFFHKQLSPNDENIAYGQLMYVQNTVETRHALSLHHISGRDKACLVSTTPTPIHH